MKKRHKMLVDRSVQGAIAGRFLMHWLTLGGVLLILMCLIQMLTDPFASPRQTLAKVLTQQGAFLCLLGAMTPVFMWDAMKLSNRFAGPVVRLRGALESLGRGETPAPVQFRDGDFWKDLAVQFNAVRDRVERLEREALAASPDAASSKETQADEHLEPCS